MADNGTVEIDRDTLVELRQFADAHLAGYGDLE